MITRKSAIILIVLSLAAAYSGYWYYARGVALQVIHDWTEQRRADGYKISHDPPRIGGFPHLIRAVLENPELSRDGFTFRGERLRIELQPWNFRRLRFDFLGKQWITPSSNADRVTLTTAEAAVVATLSDTGRLADAKLLIRDMQASDSNDVSPVRAAEIWLEFTAPDTPPKTHTDQSLSLSLSAVDVLLPEQVDGPLGRTLSKFRADLQLRGPMPGGAAADALETWRRSGGTVDVDWLQVVWGDFDLRAKGTIALDEQARPIGAFSTDIRGHNAALDALVAHSILKVGESTMAKIGLALLAKSPPEGGASVLSLPVTAQDGRLFAGPLKILDLDPIRLPAPRP